MAVDTLYTVQQRDGHIEYSDSGEGISASLAVERFDALILPRPEIMERTARPEHVARAFMNPVGSSPLRTIARGKKSAAIIVSDATRAVPTGDVLPHIMEELRLGGVPPEAVTCVVGIGVHRPATSEEMSAILGEEWAGTLRIENHDPYDEAKLVSLGTTSRGTPLSVNRTVYESELRITVGKVEPHEFAGFSGGRKSVLPGISSEEAIRVNHRPQMLLDPRAAIGVYDDNPISCDMAEAAQMLGVHFSVNILVNARGEIADLVCGDMDESHRRAVDMLQREISVPFDVRKDLFVTTPGYPLDINLYQSLKCVIALAPVLRDNGVFVVYSRCTEGVGSTDMLRPFEGATGFEDVIRFLLEKYEIQMDHALLLSKIMQRGIRIVLISPNVPEDDAKKMGFLTAKTLEEGVRKGLDMAGAGSRATFFPCPQRYLSIMNGERP